MNDDTQIKHHIWWIIKTLGKLPETYAEFLKEPLSKEICDEVDQLVAHIKTNY